MGFIFPYPKLLQNSQRFIAYFNVNVLCCIWCTLTIVEPMFNPEITDA